MTSMRRPPADDEPRTMPRVASLPDAQRVPRSSDGIATDDDPDALFQSFLERANQEDDAPAPLRLPTADEWLESVEQLLDVEGTGRNRSPYQDSDITGVTAGHTGRTPLVRLEGLDDDPPNASTTDGHRAVGADASSSTGRFDEGDASDADSSVMQAVAVGDENGTMLVVPLTRRKTLPPGSVEAPTDSVEVHDASPPPSRHTERTALIDSRTLAARLRDSDPPSASGSHAKPSRDRVEREEEHWDSVVPAPSDNTARREALRLVPDVATVEPPAPPPVERSEDGLIPSNELDRTLSDMAVLLRYGHEEQVRGELEQLRRRYPQDLLLVRRIAEFYIQQKQNEQAMEMLFTLASGLFERRNVEGMRQALEQVLVIDPSSERARRLLELLERRPSVPPRSSRS